MQIEYQHVASLAAEDFLGLLYRSGLAERRPVDDRARIARMLANSNLIIVARDRENGALVGVARSVTDFSFCCYLSDLAVDRAYQCLGIGKRLIEETRAAAGPGAMCLLLSAPDAMGFYKAIGMDHPNNAFMYHRQD